MDLSADLDTLQGVPMHVAGLQSFGLAYARGDGVPKNEVVAAVLLRLASIALDAKDEPVPAEVAAELERILGEEGEEARARREALERVLSGADD